MGRPLTREILRPQHVQTCPHVFLFMFDLFTRSVSCHFRQLPLDNKVIPSFTSRAKPGWTRLFPEVSPVGNDVLRLIYRTFHPWQTSAIQCPRLVENVEN